MSLPAMSLGLRFCASRKGGAGVGGWVHPKSAKIMSYKGQWDEVLSFKNRTIKGPRSLK